MKLNSFEAYLIVHSDLVLVDSAHTQNGFNEFEWFDQENNTKLYSYNDNECVFFFESSEYQTWTLVSEYCPEQFDYGTYTVAAKKIINHILIWYSENK